MAEKKAEYPLDALIAEADAAWAPMNQNQSTEFASYRVQLEICKELKIMNQKLKFIANEVRRDG